MQSILKGVVLGVFIVRYPLVGVNIRGINTAPALASNVEATRSSAVGESATVFQFNGVCMISVSCVRFAVANVMSVVALFYFKLSAACGLEVLQIHILIVC